MVDTPSATELLIAEKIDDADVICGSVLLYGFLHSLNKEFVTSIQNIISEGSRIFREMICEETKDGAIEGFSPYFPMYSYIEEDDRSILLVVSPSGNYVGVDIAGKLCQ